MRRQPLVNTSHVEHVLAIRKQPRFFSILQIAQTNSAFHNRGRIATALVAAVAVLVLVVRLVVSSFKDEGGERGNDGGVEASVVGRIGSGGVSSHGEAEMMDGRTTAGLAAEDVPGVEMKGKDED